MLWTALVLSVVQAAPVSSVHADHLAHPPRLPIRARAHRSPPDPVPPPERIVYGYYAPWAGELTDLDWARLTHVAVFNVDLNADGSVSGMSGWDTLGPQAVALAAPHGVKIHLALTCFDDDVMTAVLPDTTRRGILVDTLAAAVDRAGADGVSVDCEGVPGALRDPLTTLVAELQAEVDEVSIATPAIDWSDAFDKAALSIHADQIFIMGYDYHWAGGDPGPVAPLMGGAPWSVWSLSDTVATYLAEGADPARLVLGLPLYGRTWASTDNTVPGTATASGTSVTLVEGVSLADTHGRRYDTVTDTPYTFISATSQTWYDDPASIQTKVHWAVDAGLGGVGFWALNYEGNDPDFWAMITDETTGLSTEDTGAPADSGGADGGAGSGGDTGGSGGSGGGDRVDDSGAMAEPKGTRLGQNVPSCAGGAVAWLCLLGPVVGWRRRGRTD
jgi:hypothetical protein